MDPEARQRHMLDLTKRLIHAQSAREPGINLFEDLHWIDPASEAFANHVEATQGTRGLTIVNFRPEYRAAWMSKSYYRQIALSPWGRRRSRRCSRICWARIRPWRGCPSWSASARRQPLLHGGGRPVAD